MAQLASIIEMKGFLLPFERAYSEWNVYFCTRKVRLSF